MSKDMRAFLERMRKDFPNDFVSISKRVEPHKFGATGIVYRLMNQKKYPVVLFENITDIRGKETNFSLVMGAFLSRRRAKIALGYDPTTDMSTIWENMKDVMEQPIKSTIVNEAGAPVKEVVKVGEDVDLSQLPLVRHHDMDPRFYFNAIIAAKDPFSPRHNLSWHRMMYLDKRHICLYASPRHLWHYFQLMEQKGQPLPIAAIWGHHPTLYISASANVPITGPDEYDVAGAYLRESLRLVPSQTWGNDLLIPADAEVVLEGIMKPMERAVEAPYGEGYQYYGAQRLAPVVEVKAINQRKHSIMLDVVVGPESYYANIGYEMSFYHHLKSVVPTVKAVNAGDKATCTGVMVIISLKKTMEGQQGRAAMAALGFGIYPKIVILVDDDIDPYDYEQVLWAISSRVQPHNDVQVVNQMLRSFAVEPSKEHEDKTSALIIDATWPLDRLFPDTTGVSDEVLHSINLEDYITQDRLATLI